MSMLYNSYYRAYGVRKLGNLANPPKAPLALMELPRSSLYHYVPQTASDVGPRSDELVFRGVTRAVSLMFQNDPLSLVGDPRVKTVDIQSLVKDFYLKNRGYRRLRELKAVEGSIDTQVAISYSFINNRLHYLTTSMSAYHQWYNLNATIWKTVGKTVRETQRHQFVPVYVPQSINSPATLNRFSEEMTKQGLSYFSTPEDLFLLEIWKWITDNRAKSMLSEVRDEDLHKVNLVFIDRNTWFVLNLARLDSWRKTPPGEVQRKKTEFQDEEAPANGAGVIVKETSVQPPLLLAKLFLRGLMTVIAGRTQSVEEVKETYEQSVAEQTQPATVPNASAPGTGVQSEQDRAAAEAELDITEAELKQLKAFRARQEANFADIDLDAELEFNEDDIASDERLAAKIARAAEIGAEVNNATAPELPDNEEALKELEAALDEDLQVLSTIETKRIEREERLAEASQGEELEPLPPEEPFSHEPDKRLMALCDQIVERGGMTGSDYRRFERLSQKYKTIEMPNGQTLEEFVQVPPEDLVIDPGKGDTITQFTEQYVKKVMDKDIANMILGVQAGGVAVTDLKVKDIVDITGHDREYTIRLVPIEGEPTTIRATFPVPNERGVFKAGGVSYRYRKQQGVAMPIKKTDEREVVLTSYYGKTFVRKPEFKVSDYQSWICNQIRAADLNNKGISNLVAEPHIDAKWRCPLYFTYIGKEISSFTAQALGKSYQFDFRADDTVRNELFGEEALKAFDQAGARVIAKSNDGDYLVMQEDNSIVRMTTDGLRVEAGTIESVLGFTTGKVPVEYTQLSTMGQEIPIGVILGYYHGFNWLLRRFRPTFRKVMRGGRTNLQSTEYAVQFADETFIFDRREIFNTLIFSGWNKYRNAIRNYTYREFNDQGVYMNVMEDVGVSYRILSELDRMRNMFVDPITRDLLISMKEPTEFDKLLIRSTELLVDGYVPLVRDRVRGYERFAGAFYREITRTLRAHDNRYGRNKAKLDFNPTEVNKAILSDAAKMQVTEINPIEDIKQEEAISHSGEGGRSGRALTRDDRVYQMDEHAGLVSEATVDNDKVAVNAYMSAKPKILNVRGINEGFDLETDPIESLVSTSMLVSPCSDRDDAKRV